MTSAEPLIRLEFPSRADRLKILRCTIQCAAEMVGCKSDTANQIVIAVNEACMNIIQHAYDGEPSGRILVEISQTDRHLQFQLTDSGKPVDPTQIRARDLKDIRPGGLGVHLISEIMDAVEYRRSADGNENLLTMLKRIA